MMKSTPDELYDLEKVTDDPRFEGFALKPARSILGNESLDDDITPGFKVNQTSHAWKQPRLNKKWLPPIVSGRVQSYNDFPGLDMMYPVFSARAVRVLRPMLEANGELLPLKTDVGEYFFYNITTIVDALDVEKSKCNWFSERKGILAVTIDYFAFHKEKLAGLTIFRIYQNPIATIVTDEFKLRVEDAGLNGFNFIKIWPFKRGVNWRMHDKEINRMENRKKQKLKGETLVIRLSLKGKKPSASEKKLIERYEDELDARLAVTALDAPYLGSYEGNDTVDGEYRMFVSTPDVNQLHEHLESWLASLNWPAYAEIAKRFGNLHDSKAKEEFVQIS